ncbi:MAG: Alpha-ketoacid dehydrogenase subunit beta [Thermoleophilia bacterium]|nr:Alpha-ketoacid dehydrogenase subunit beta [Thermoleophilia bacterium]
MAQMTYREAVKTAMAEELRRDQRVLFMGEDIADMGGSQGVSKGMLAEFGPGRIRNTPISEEGIVGAAVGAAMSGLRPIVEIMYMDFTSMAMDPIVGQAAKWRYMTGGQVTIPVTIRTQGGAGWQSGSQHASMLESWFTHIPGLKVVMTSQPDDARLLLKAAIRDENPVLFIEHRDCYPRKGEVGEDPEEVGELGVGRKLREGTDCTIVCWGGMPWAALEAAEQLEAEDGISLEIIDPRTLQPFDLGIVLESVRKTNRCVIAHEAVTFGGFGAEIAALVQEHAFDHLDAPVLRVGEKWAPVPFAPVLEDYVVPGKAEIIEAVRSVAYATA